MKVRCIWALCVASLTLWVFSASAYAGKNPAEEVEEWDPVPMRSAKEQVSEHTATKAKRAAGSDRLVSKADTELSLQARLKGALTTLDYWVGENEKRRSGNRAYPGMDQIDEILKFLKADLADYLKGDKSRPNFFRGFVDKPLSLEERVATLQVISVVTNYAMHLGGVKDNQNNNENGELLRLVDTFNRLAGEEVTDSEKIQQVALMKTMESLRQQLSSLEEVPKSRLYQGAAMTRDEFAGMVTDEYGMATLPKLTNTELWSRGVGVEQYLDGLNQKFKEVRAQKK